MSIKQMKIDFTDPATKAISKTILFYVVALIILFILEKAMPSGPCAPGLGMLGFMALPFISAILLFLNVVKFFSGNRSSKIPGLIHLLFIIGYILLLKFSLL